MDLLAGLDRLDGGGKGGGALADVEKRHAFVTTLRSARSTSTPRSGRRRSRRSPPRPSTAGLKIVPQLGLVPLGPDPDSGLYEFAHLGSGSIPRATRRRSASSTRRRGDRARPDPGRDVQDGRAEGGPEGPNYDPQAERDESPVHEVTLSPFFLAKHECTQAQWEAMTEGRRSRVRTRGAGRPVTSRPTPRNPVEQISWEDCTLWLARNRLALPTEAQWEYACRAGTDTPWIYRARRDPLGEVGNIADKYLKGPRRSTHGPTPWRWTTATRSTRPSGRIEPNGFGLYDMHGNVFEWCHDRWGAIHPRRSAILCNGPSASGCPWRFVDDVAEVARSSYATDMCRGTAMARSASAPPGRWNRDTRCVLSFVACVGPTSRLFVS